MSDRFVFPAVDRFPLNLDLPRAEACTQVADELYNDILSLHDYAIHLAGGATGIRRSEELLTAALRPFTTLYDEWAFPTGIHQAAALLQSLAQGHAFVDGNKRTALLGTAYFLDACNYWPAHIFVSAYELHELEDLILRVSNESRDLLRGNIAHKYEVEDVALALHEILAPSQQRSHMKPARAQKRGFIASLLHFLDARGGDK